MSATTATSTSISTVARATARLSARLSMPVSMASREPLSTRITTISARASGLPLTSSEMEKPSSAVATGFSTHPFSSGRGWEIPISSRPTEPPTEQPALGSPHSSSAVDFPFRISNLPVPPVYNKANPADAPVLTLAVTSASMPLPLVQDLVDTRLSPKLSQLSGVGRAPVGVQYVVATPINSPRSH